MIFLGPVSSRLLVPRQYGARLIREWVQVADQMSTLLTAQLLFLEAEDAEKPIKLYINSPGGSVTAGLGIYDTVSAKRGRRPTKADETSPDRCKSVACFFESRRMCFSTDLPLRSAVRITANTHILHGPSSIHGIPSPRRRRPRPPILSSQRKRHDSP